MSELTPDLSILVCSVSERYDNFAVSIQRQIYEQVQRLTNPKSVEVIMLTDNRHMTIGTKRNHLVAMATGRYTVFVDDDDELAPDYVASLVDATTSGADVLTFQLEYRLNGKKQRIIRQSIRYSDDNRRGLNTPRHTSAVRREITSQLPFVESSYGEDSDWATRLLKIAKTEHIIDRVLYIYLDVPATSIARQYAAEHSPGAYQAWLKTQTSEQDYSLGPRLAKTYEGTLDHVLGLNPSGSAIEFGVGSGNSLRRIAQKMPVVGFDSFEGLPERWRDGFEAGSFACMPPDVPNSALLCGWFKDTLPWFCFTNLDVGLWHLDADLYSSTATILNHIGPYLKSGAYIVFDEYHGYPGADGAHEQKAWREFVERTNIKWSVIGHGPEQWAIRIK
ncbi:hypothetical protein B5566_02525 [Mycobacterium sp. MHSD3]|nr:hypothetical protein B5566_02525 [Mycobacterium sp. MHSD3]